MAASSHHQLKVLGGSEFIAEEQVEPSSSIRGYLQERSFLPGSTRDWQSSSKAFLLAISS